MEQKCYVLLYSPGHSLIELLSLTLTSLLLEPQMRCLILESVSLVLSRQLLDSIHCSTCLTWSYRGDFRGVVTLHPNGAPSRLAFVWMDRDRRYFISNTSSLAEGAPYIRERWRQVAEVETNEEPQMTELTIPMLKAPEVHYSACGMID